MNAPPYIPDGTGELRINSPQRSLSNISGVWGSMTGKNGGVVLDNIAGASIAYVDPGGVTATLSLTRTGRTFVVNLARAASAISTTAADIKALMEADTVANSLFTIAYTETNGAGLVTAMTAATPTAGVITINPTGANNGMTFTAKQTATGPFSAIAAIDDAVVASAVLTEAWGGYTALTAASLSAGAAVVMGFASVTRTSGTIACYY